MALQSHTMSTPTVSESTEISGVYIEGVGAGPHRRGDDCPMVFRYRFLQRRPFYTPNVLGTALSLSGAAGDPTTVPVSMESVIFYSWIHVPVFCVIGGLAAELLSLAERDIHFGFGILLLFIIFEFGFVAAAMVFAEPILRLWRGRRSWSAIYSRPARWRFTSGAIIRRYESHRERESCNVTVESWFLPTVRPPLFHHRIESLLKF